MVSFPVGKKEGKGLKGAWFIFREMLSDREQSSDFAKVFVKVILKDRCSILPETRSHLKKNKRKCVPTRHLLDIGGHSQFPILHIAPARQDSGQV